MALIKFPCNSEKHPIVKGWQTYTGEVTTPIYGIVIPNKVIIIDVDTYKGVTIEQVESVLGCKPNWNNALIQKTLNGGHHYAFLVSDLEQLVQGSNLLGLEGLDTRVSGKGYIATGKGYEDMTLDGVEDALETLDLPVLPEEAVKRLRVGAKANTMLSADDVTGLEEAIAAQPLDISFDDVKTYVELLTDEDAADQDTWLKVGMAISHQTKNSNEGWDLFDAFSKRSPDNYDRKANFARWKSFPSDRSSRITFATIINMTKRAKKLVDSVNVIEQVKDGIENATDLVELKKGLQVIAESRLDKIALDSMLKKFQGKYKELSGGDTASLSSIRGELKVLRENKNKGDFVNDYVFLTATAEYCDRLTKSVMGPRAFDVKHNRETPLNTDGEKQSATVYANDLIDVVEDTMYFPKAGEIFTHAGRDYLNRYMPCTVAPVAVGTTDIVERIKGHVAHLLPDPREQEIFIQYLAHNVQFPGEKLNWAIVLQGVQGDGKSFFSEMMQHVMGFDNVRLMNVQTLEGSFTGWAEGQCMTFIEELKLDNYKKYEVLNNLKPYISNPMIEVRALYKNSRTVLNTTNYIGLTNFKDSLPIDANDRRYCILFSQWQDKKALEDWMAENPNYYPNLYDAMRNNVGELIQWLKTYQITDEFKAMKRAPHTDAKDKMCMLSRGSDVVCVEEVLEEFANKIARPNGEIDITRLKECVMGADQFDKVSYENFPKDKRLANILSDMGYELVGRKSVQVEDNVVKKHTIYKKR